jgi:hypothetical protein
MFRIHPGHTPIASIKIIKGETAKISRAPISKERPSQWELTGPCRTF